MSTRAIIHCNPFVAWQPKRAAFFVEGFKRIGVETLVTDSRQRIAGGFPVLLGTTFWKGIEADGLGFLLVDRCSFGDTEKYVSLVWSGHGRRGNHLVPHSVDASRWESMGLDLAPWQQPRGSRVVLCGQTASYSPMPLESFYRCVKATHFRKHPAGDNPTGLPAAADFTDAIAVTLNSSIGVQCVINGIQTVTMDEGAMAWEVTAHSVECARTFDREHWAHRLAWTQWSDDEIREGMALRHMLNEFPVDIRKSA